MSTRPSPPRAADGQWQRVHPLTPAVRSWQFVVVIMILIGQEWGQRAAQGEGVDPGQFLHGGAGELLAGGGVAAVVVLVIIAFAVLSWRMTRYRVTQDAVEIHHGIIFRQQRRARLDRLQAIDVVQPLVARVVGLARLSLEVAGGSGSKITLSYLTEKQAQQLRNHLLARAAGVRYETEEAPEAPEHQVLHVSVPRLVGSLALSTPMLSGIVIVIVLAVTAVLTRSLAAVAGVFPMAVAVVSVLWQRFTGGFGFRVATSPDGLRLRHGLLEQRTQTVPPGRVQAVRVSQPLLWRGVDWWRVRVNVAGYGREGNNHHDTESTLLPVGRRDEAMAVLAFVLPDLGSTGADPARAVIDAGLSGSGPGAGYVTSPRRARWLDPLAWRRNGYRVTGEALVIRRGWAHRHLDLIPHARTQSCGVAQGPVERLLGVASFTLHSTPGPISPKVPHLAVEAAALLLEEQSTRARAARLAAGPERWMEQPVPTGPVRPDQVRSADPPAGGPPPAAPS